MRPTNRLKSQHLLWRAAFGPSVALSAELDEVSPKKIRYEYCHLPNQLEVDNFLKSRKYKIELCQCDPTFNKVCTLKNN